MARTTVSIPDELKAQMDEIKENWSAIASAAFQEVVAKKCEPDARLAMLERLKLQCEAGVAEMRVTGRKWAQETASIEQLLRLSQIKFTNEDPTEWPANEWLGARAILISDRLEYECRHFAWTWQGFFGGIILDGYEKLVEDDSSHYDRLKKTKRQLNERTADLVTGTLYGDRLSLDDNSTIDMTPFRNLLIHQRNISSISLRGTYLTLTDDSGSVEVDLLNYSNSHDSKSNLYKSLDFEMGDWINSIANFIPAIPDVDRLEDEPDLLRNHPDSERYLDAFYEGALEAWNEVKADLPPELLK